jgi:hypothetical protein
MITRIFVTLCLAMMASVPLHADELRHLSIKISLGIRDTKALSFTNLTYPLAFRIENTGKTVIKGDQIPGLFFKGVIHILPKDGQEQHDNFQKMWRTRIYELKPGATFESPDYADLLTFFPSAKDGVYDVWWTFGDMKSNVLHFSVTKRKVFSNDPES